MSFISSFLSPSVSFIAEPITSYLSGISAEASLQPTVLAERRITLSCMNEYFSNKVEGVALDKINRFIASLGFRDKKIFIVIDNNISAATSSQGSLKDGNAAAIIFKSQIILEIEQDFTFQHQFCIAHELAHLIYDDTCQGVIEKERQINLTRIYTYATSIFSLICLSPYSLFTIHLTSCAITKAVGLLQKRYLNYNQEFKADAWAATQSEEIARGGLLYFHNEQIEDVETIKQILAKCELELENTKPMVKKVIFLARFFFLKAIFFTHQNVVCLLNSHPANETRLAKIAKILETHKEYEKDMQVLVNACST